MPPEREVKLDEGLQARLLEQMREEQAARARSRMIVNLVVIPLTIVAIVVGTMLSFSDDMGVALVANLIASGLAYVLYRVNKERVRGFFGRE